MHRIENPVDIKKERNQVSEEHGKAEEQRNSGKDSHVLLPQQHTKTTVCLFLSGLLYLQYIYNFIKEKFYTSETTVREAPKNLHMLKQALQLHKAIGQICQFH